MKIFTESPGISQRKTFQKGQPGRNNQTETEKTVVERKLCQPGEEGKKIIQDMEKVTSIGWGKVRMEQSRGTEKERDSDS